MLHEDTMDLIRTKESVAAMTFLAEHEPSFSKEQKDRLRVLANRMDKLGCSYARFVKLDAEEVTLWMSRLEAVVVEIESGVAAPAETKIPVPAL